MPRIMIHCPSGGGEVPTGYRTTDVDLTVASQSRFFRCSCGRIHDWKEDVAWAEVGPSAWRGGGLEPALRDAVLSRSIE